MCDTLKKEFKWKNFRFGHEKAEAFSTAQWRWHPAVYLAYRALTACYTVAWLLEVTLTSIPNNGRHNIMAFLTIWTYLILTLYMVASLLVSAYCWCQAPMSSENVVLPKTTSMKTKSSNVAVINASFLQEKTDEGSMVNSVSINGQTTTNEKMAMSNGSDVTLSIQPEIQRDCVDTTKWYMKLTWLLADILYVFGIIVTVIYFGAIFPYTGINGEFATDFNMHGVNTVLILIDVAVVARPVRLLHAIYPAIYGMTYVIFSAIYWSEDNEHNVLYKGILDWNVPATTMVCIVVLALIGIPLLQLFHFGLYQLRLHLHRKIYGQDYC